MDQIIIALAVLALIAGLGAAFLAVFFRGERDAVWGEHTVPAWVYGVLMGIRD